MCAILLLDVMCASMILAGMGTAWLLLIGGKLGVASCYWLAWAGQVVRGKEHVCSLGRLPQIIKIGKFHARLLMIGGFYVCHLAIG